MATSSAPAVIDNVTSDGDQDPARGERQLLGKLARLWLSHERQSLATYHKTGILLNEHLGPPTERQRRGKQVLQKTGERLKISESELSRMRWLSHLFSDLAAMAEAHPDIRSWTQFKVALPGLKPRKEGEATKPPANGSRPALRGLAKTLENVCKKLRLVDQPAEDGATDDILGRLRELADVVNDRLRIRITVEATAPTAVPSETTPLAIEG